MLCFGTFRLKPSRQTGIQALHEAIDLGINTLHSSPEYGSFEHVCDVLDRHSKRADLHHVLKVPSPGYGQRAFDPTYFRRQIDESLAALGVERIAIVQHLHRGPAPESEVYGEEGDRLRIPLIDEVSEPLLEVAEELKASGKIGALVSYPHTMTYARRLMDSSFDGFAHPFGVLETEMTELLDDITERNKFLIGIRPLLQGILTDRGVARSRLPRKDPLREERLDPWYRQLELLRQSLGSEPRSWTNFAVRFAVTPRAVVTSAIGLDTVEHVRAAVDAVDEGPLSLPVVELAHDMAGRLGSIPKSTLVRPHTWNARTIASAILRRARAGVRRAGSR